MTDFIIGTAIGALSAFLTCGAFWLRGGYSTLWPIIFGTASGYVGGMVAAFLVFCFLLAEAFRPR